MMMASFQVDLSERRFAKLQEMASCLGVSPEELLRVSVEEFLDRPKDEFLQVVNRVMKKNEELYKRLS
jgi:hypothetical protein